MVKNISILWQAFGCENYCQQCFVTCNDKKRYGVMDKKKFFETAHEIYSAKKQLKSQVTTFILSEQLAAPYWRELLQDKEVREIMYSGNRKQSLDSKIGMATNGYTLAREKNAARELAELGVKDIQLSFYAGNAELHDSLARRVGAFDDLITAMWRAVDTGKIDLDIVVYPYEHTVGSIPDFFRFYVDEIEAKKGNRGKHPKTSFTLQGLCTFGRLYGKDHLLPTEQQLEWLVEEFVRVTGLPPEKIREKHIQTPVFFDSEKNILESFIEHYDNLRLFPEKPKPEKKHIDITLEDNNVFHALWSYMPLKTRNKNKELFYIDRLDNGKSLADILRDYKGNFSKHPINQLDEQNKQELEQTARTLLETATHRMYNTSFANTWLVWRMVNLIENNNNKVTRPMK